MQYVIPSKIFSLKSYGIKKYFKNHCYIKGRYTNKSLILNYLRCFLFQLMSHDHLPFLFS